MHSHMREASYAYPQTFNASPDESSYNRMLLNKADVTNSLLMIQPTLISCVLHEHVHFPCGAPIGHMRVPIARARAHGCVRFPCGPLMRHVRFPCGPPMRHVHIPVRAATFVCGMGHYATCAFPYWPPFDI